MLFLTVLWEPVLENCHQCLGSKGGMSRELMLRMCCAFLQATMVTWILDVLSVFKTCVKEGLKKAEYLCTLMRE